jgi:E3 ubiquitin-protein ligase HERC2
MHPGKKFMSELLVNSLMADGSLESALENAIENEMSSHKSEKDKDHGTETKDMASTVPILHLAQQLLKTSSAHVRAEFQEMILKPPKLQWPYTLPARTTTVELLLKLQRLLIGNLFVREGNDKPWFINDGKGFY